MFLMLSKETLKDIVLIQNDMIKSRDIGVERELIEDIDLGTEHAVIISGVRRCGKSTLLKQLIKKVGSYHYFNFEDPRAINFEVSDFHLLEKAFGELGGDEYYFFDEIQNVDGWERLVRSALDSGKKVVVTGSNASLLSRELGTKLTGRHLTYELFPMSFKEMLRLKGESPSLPRFKEYLERGGFPEYLKYGNDGILQGLFSDIVLKDVVVRHKLRDPKLAENLALNMLTNAGKEFTHNRLKRAFNMGNITTAVNYVSFLEDTYLVFSVPGYYPSPHQQLVNPKKAYAIDTAVVRANTLSFSRDLGNMIENVVFLHLRRKTRSIYYYKGQHECDFLIKEKGAVRKAIQVCCRLDENNRTREIEGLKEVMARFHIDRGLILTMDQEDEYEDIDVMPVWKWLISRP